MSDNGKRLPKLLWVSDACSPTGFARVTHNVLGWLGTRWERVVIGVNSTGDPHPYPYEVFPARTGGDLWGFNRFIKLVPKIEPDVILIQTDSWILEGFLEVAEKMIEGAKIKGKKLTIAPMVGYMPVDALGMKRGTALNLGKFARLIFYTSFGREQAESAGFKGKSAVAGLGIDKRIYYPRDKAQARARLLPQLPPGAFVIGNVNRNQPRKRLDLSIKYFAEWLKRGGDGYLYLHALREDTGWDLVELAHWYGIADRLFMPEAPEFEDLFAEQDMPDVYSALDVSISTSVGEGFGLTTLEAMACGVPCVVPDFAALGDWARGGVRLIPAEPGEASWGYKAFGIGAVANMEAFLVALTELRQDPEKRESLARAGKALADEDEFSWLHIATIIDRELRAVIAEREGDSNVDKREFDGPTVQRLGGRSSDAPM